ncbi:MAG: hypothetical protein FJ222_00765 [Lentisphaerae bacterium]|nr:hypothetical protein [Lentisphaerota bacterium]
MADRGVHEALAQVREMQGVVQDRLRFRGFSSRARMIGGCVALIGAAVLGRFAPPDAPLVHLAGWAAVLVLAGGVNYGALLLWMGRAGRWQRRAEWVPALESLPPLGVGGALSIALWRVDAMDLLPGVWMLCYGLVHLAYRRNLPVGVYLVGFFYLVAGAVCLMMPGLQFTDPRPMGLVFGVGEVAGGLALRGGNDEKEAADDGFPA